MKPKCIRRFGYRFSMLHRIHFALASEEIQHLDITTAQLPLLLVLMDETQAAELTQDEIARALAMDPGTTARHLDHLEKKGFVQRRINPKNRRQKLVSLRPSALKLEKPIFDALQHASDILVAGLEETEQETALALLDRMLENGLKARADK